MNDCIPKPTNRDLYKKIKIKTIRNSAKWPSRYASYELVDQYKKAGGGFTCGFGSKELKTCGFGNCKRCETAFGSKELKTCGFGNCKRCGTAFGSCGCELKKNSFGADFMSFYEKGTDKNTHLNDRIRKGLGNMYSQDASFSGKGYQPDILLRFGNVRSEISYLKSL